MILNGQKKQISLTQLICESGEFYAFFYLVIPRGNL